MQSLKLFSATILLMLSLTSCVPNQFQDHQKFVETHLLNNPELVTNYIKSDNFQLHYREIGKAKQAIAIWIHGTPGNWTDSAYLCRDKDFISQVKLVMLDRPGWGESQYRNNPRPVTSFEEIGDLIKPLLLKMKRDYPDIPILLLGHSWGGSLVPSIALNHPELVGGVLVLAAGLSPELTKPRWYNRFVSTSFGNSIIGNGLRQANIEIYALRPQLSSLHNRWFNLTQPIIVVQGETDKLVNPKNADYAESVLPKNNSRVLRLSKQGHLLQLERMDLIARCVMALAKNNLNQCS